MKRIIITAMLVTAALFSFSQSQQPFKGYIYNEEYQVYIKMNLYDKDIKVPGQEIFGDLPGYFGAKRDTRLWLILSVETVKENEASITIINDYGSEDLTATIVANADGTYTLKQEEGSKIKIVVDRKWVKIPDKLIFKSVDDDKSAKK